MGGIDGLGTEAGSCGIDDINAGEGLGAGDKDVASLHRQRGIKVVHGLTDG